MKRIFRIAVSLFLVLNILISITGISVLEHLCDCHPAVRLSLLPGLISAQSDCCCTDHAEAGHHVQHQTACHVNSKDHCRDVRTFLRKEILADTRIIRSDVSAFQFIIPDKPSLHDLSNPLSGAFQSDPVALKPPSSLSRLILYHSFRYSPSEPPLC